MPVITPFELELGLGARTWSSTYLTSYTSSYTPTLTATTATTATGSRTTETDMDTTTDTATLSNIAEKTGEHTVEVSSTTTTSSSSSSSSSTETQSSEACQGTGTETGMLESFSTRLQRVLEARANRSQDSDSDSSSDEEEDEAYVQYVNTFKQPAGDRETMSQALALLTVQEKEENPSGSSGHGGGGKLIAFESPAAEYLLSREYQGLEAATQEGTSTRIAQGQFGIAAGYEQLSEQRDETHNKEQTE